MRVVLDANVLVSALYGGGEMMATIRRALSDGTLEPCVGPAIAEEVRRTLAKPWFAARLPQDLAHAFLDELDRHARLCPPLVIERVIADDPDDDAVLATAVAFGAEAIVSGDRHLLAIAEHRGIRILSPRDFVAELASREMPAEAL